MESVFFSLFSLVDDAYLAIISPFWNLAVNYGLNPDYSFYSIIGTNSAYVNIYNLVFASFYFILAEILILGGIIAFMITNPFLGPVNRNTFIIRLGIGAILPLFALQVLSLFLNFSGDAFLSIWNGAGINWSSGLSLVNLGSGLQSISGVNSTYLPVMEFFFLSGYFLSIVSLIITLELRQALLIVLSIAIPIFSITFVIPKLDQYAMRLWKLFFEAALFPFFTIIGVYFAIEYSGVFLLQLAFLIFAGSSPFVIVSAFRIFSSGSFLGIVNGLSLENSIGRAANIGSSVASMDALRTGLSVAGINPSVAISGSKNGGINWQEIYNRDFDYRREW